MPDETTISYEINKRNIIQFVSDSWDRFAIENAAPQIQHQIVIGRCLLDFITNIEVKDLYHRLIQNVRDHGRDIEFHFRCDSADQRRHMRISMHLLSDEAIRFNSQLLHEESRAAVKLLEPDQPRNKEFLLICSWCNKLRLEADEWVEIEVAINKLHLFESDKLPQISHGICPQCLAEVTQKL